MIWIGAVHSCNDLTKVLPLTFWFSQILFPFLKGKQELNKMSRTPDCWEPSATAFLFPIVSISHAAATADYYGCEEGVASSGVVCQQLVSFYICVTGRADGKSELWGEAVVLDVYNGSFHRSFLHSLIDGTVLVPSWTRASC